MRAYSKRRQLVDKFYTVPLNLATSSSVPKLNFLPQFGSELVGVQKVGRHPRSGSTLLTEKDTVEFLDGVWFPVIVFNSKYRPKLAV